MRCRWFLLGMRAQEHTVAIDAAIAVIVDDNPHPRSLAAATMSGAGLQSLEAADVDDALAYLSEDAPDVRLIFAGHDPCGRRDGIDLARLASVRWPWIKVMLTSGAAGIRDVPQNVVFLPKPCGPTDLCAHLEWEAARAKATAPSAI
jgi:DNA-binding NtrC family response regulator